jgi:hypothetical protein
MALQTAIPFWTGKAARITFVFHDNHLALNVTSWNIKREGTKITDDICDSDRSEVQYVTDGYTMQLDCKERRLDALKVFIQNQKAEDEKTLKLEGEVGVTITPNDGTKLAFAMIDMTLLDWEMGSKGRKATNDFKIPLHFQYLEPLPNMGM